MNLLERFFIFFADITPKKFLFMAAAVVLSLLAVLNIYDTFLYRNAPPEISEVVIEKRANGSVYLSYKRNDPDGPRNADSIAWVVNGRSLPEYDGYRSIPFPNVKTREVKVMCVVRAGDGVNACRSFGSNLLSLENIYYDEDSAEEETGPPAAAETAEIYARRAVSFAPVEPSLSVEEAKARKASERMMRRNETGPLNLSTGGPSAARPSATPALPPPPVVPAVKTGARPPELPPAAVSPARTPPAQPENPVAPAAESAPEFEISGKVVDVFGENRIYKAVVAFGDNSFETGASGHFIAKVRRGAYPLKVAHPDYYERTVRSFSVSGDAKRDFYLIPRSFDLKIYEKYSGYSLDRFKFNTPPTFIINTDNFKESKNTFTSKQIDTIYSVIGQIKSISDFFNGSSIVRRGFKNESEVPENSIAITRDDRADYIEGGHAQYLPRKRSSIVVINPLYNRLEGYFEVVMRHELMHAIGFYTHLPQDFDSILVPTLPMPPDFTGLDRKVIKLFYRMPFGASYPHSTERE